jgi:LDH2 family malate/lactate/ureidoglycolate dehydrogenase
MSPLALLRRTNEISGPLWTASLVLDRLRVPALRFWSSRRVAVDTLSRQICLIFEAWGMAADDIATTTDLLMYADIHGIDSHGCAMLKKYSVELAAGRLTMTPEVRIVSESESTGLLDGGGGLGHVPADKAMKMAIAKCRQAGIAAVAVRNSGHFGAAGAYAAMAAEAGLIGFAATNTPPAIVPTFGVQAMLGTNPIAFAAPATRNRPFLLDMATSAAPVGRLMTAWRQGRSIPEGWAMDERGRPVTSPRRAFALRRLAPLGSFKDLASHKGYGLAAMVEVLSFLLPGSRPNEPREAPRPAIGHFFMAMDPGRFRPAAQFGHDLDSLIDTLRSTEPADPSVPVMVAGDPEYSARDERLVQGIPIARAVVEDLRWICRTSGVEFLLDEIV